MVSLPDINVRLRLDTTNLTQGVQQAEQKTSSLGSVLKTGLAAGAVVAGSAVVALGGFAIKTGIQTASAMQQAQISFTTLLGSAQQAKTFLAGLSTFAAHTPYDLPGLVDASRQLLGAGQTAKSVIPALTSLGNATSALGLSQDRFQHIMLAVTQSMAAGKLQAGDLLQITEAGLPIWKLLSEALGKPIPELRKLSEQGKLLSSDVWPKVFAVMNKDYGGAMEAQSKTLSGVWSTLTDTVSQSLATAFQPLIPMLSNFVPKAADFAGKAITSLGNGLSDTGRFLSRFKDEATGLVNGLRGISSGSGDSATAFNDLGRAINATVKGGLAVAKFLESIKGWLLPVAGGILAVVAAMKLWSLAETVYIASMLAGTAITEGFAAAQLALEAVMAANPIVLVILALVALVAAFAVAWKTSETFRNVVKGALSAVTNAFKSMWEFVKPVFDALVSGGRAVWTGLAAAFRVGVTVVSAILKGVIAFYDAIIKPILEIILSFVRMWWTLISAEFQIGVAVVTAVFRLLWDLWSAILKPVFDLISAAASLWWAGFKIVFSVGVEAVKAIFSTMMSVWTVVLQPIFSLILSAISLWWAGFKIVFSVGVEAVKAIWNGLVWIFTFVSSVLKSVSNATQNFQATFTGIINSIVGTVKGILSWFGGLGALFGGWFTGAYNGAIGALGKLLSWCGGLKDKILGALGNLGGMLWNVGTDIINGLIGGIEYAAGAIGRVVKAIIDKIPGPIRKAMGISSPSKVMRGIGGFIGQGLALGIEDTAALVAAASRSLGSVISIGNPAGVTGTLAMAGGGQTNNHYAPTINVSSQANPQDIADEIAWSYKYRGAR